MTSPARDGLLDHGLQTLAGFAMDDKAKDDRTVGFVEAGSPAQASGLKTGRRDCRRARIRNAKLFVVDSFHESRLAARGKVSRARHSPRRGGHRTAAVFYLG